MDETIEIDGIASGTMNIASGERVVMSIRVRTDWHGQSWEGFTNGAAVREGFFDSYNGIDISEYSGGLGGGG